MQNIIKLIKEIGKIKNVKRAGWVREGIKNPESVADHSYRVAVMAMIFGKDLNVNQDKLIKMALVHDLGEGSIGDLISQRGIKIDTKLRDAKDAKEAEAVRRVFSDNEALYGLQKEFLKVESNEAKILKQLDRLEMAVQALEYEEKTGKDLTEFFDNATMRIENEYLKKLLNEVKSSRPKKS
jgi:5'-deoxynucleotidase YfbR-like HD superfamily hydrolase